MDRFHVTQVPLSPGVAQARGPRVAEVGSNYDSEWAAIKAVAAKLGIGTAETRRSWVSQAEIDAGARPGTTSKDSAELKRLRREMNDKAPTSPDAPSRG